MSASVHESAWSGRALRTFLTKGDYSILSRIRRPEARSRAQRAYAAHCEENKRHYIADQRKCEMPKVYGP